MALIVTADQKILLDTIESHLQDAFVDGVETDLGAPVASEMEKYTHPVMAANFGLKQTQTKTPFKSLAAAIIKAVGLAGTPSGGTIAASTVTVTPSGNLSSTNVQAALQELQADIDGNTTQINNILAAGYLTATTGDARYYTKTQADDRFIKNSADANVQSGDAVGDLVYVSGDISAGFYTATKADPMNAAKVPSIAVIVSKPTSTTAKIVMMGEIAGVYTGLTPGKVYFLGTNGRPSISPPPGPGTRYAQRIGYAMASTVLFLNPNLTMGVLT